ncbi:MAG: FHA domain-containing protein [Acidimicrobiales bacterium]
MSENTCQNCNVGHGPDDMFCENCGYDFITGSLPVDADMQPAPSAAGAPASAPGMPPAGSAPAAPPSVLSNDGAESSASGEAESAATEAEAAESAMGETEVGEDVPRMQIAITVDKDFFDAVVNDGEIDFPDPVPQDQELQMAGSELHIGRTSESRAIHPDIDVADLTGDQAVSSRHAVLRVANDGSYTIVDVGSTNGTFIDAVDSEAIIHGVPIEITPGQAIYVGAWTKLMILP